MEVKYPAILFDSPTIFEVVEREEQLTICSKTALRRGYYKKLRIFDSSGRSYLINSAKKIGTLGRFWGYNFFLNQTVRVELEFSKKVEETFLEDLKEKILNAFDKGRNFWGSRGDLPELKKLVREAKTHFELIQRLVGL